MEGASDANVGKKHSREKRYSSDEIDVLIKKVYEHRHILFGNFDNTLSVQLEKTRSLLWTSIAKHVSSVNPKVPDRTKEKVKEKWKYLKSDIKLKARKIADLNRRTGKNDPEGGVQQLTPTELLVQEIITKECVEGHTEGVDTLEIECVSRQQEHGSREEAVGTSTAHGSSAVATVPNVEVRAVETIDLVDLHESCSEDINNNTIVTPLANILQKQRCDENAPPCKKSRQVTPVATGNEHDAQDQPKSDHELQGTLLAKATKKGKGKVNVKSDGERLIEIEELKYELEIQKVEVLKEINENLSVLPDIKALLAAIANKHD